ncbi:MULTISPECIES: DUF1150 family protein [unclassified Lentilitoribacter]|uniref:BQ00720 family protein n=1 Tax=unclassified Lentilitoribacter TaxID=2647570 RepID=UPI0013A6F685|nr:DUF1150 family protein [Lentilitoribacter sp. Alg239-R112]
MLSIYENDIETADEFALMGAGEVAYIRKISSEEVNERFPMEEELEPGQELWALFAADGTPIYLSDDRTRTFFRAAEDELSPVTLH